MNIVVLREQQSGEARVALMPESVRKLVALKAVVLVESNAGLKAASTDDNYREAGAQILFRIALSCWPRRTFWWWSIGRQRQTFKL